MNYPSLLFTLGQSLRHRDINPRARMEPGRFNEAQVSFDCLLIRGEKLHVPVWQEGRAEARRRKFVAHVPWIRWARYVSHQGGGGSPELLLHTLLDLHPSISSPRPILLANI